MRRLFAIAALAALLATAAPAPAAGPACPGEPKLNRAMHQALFRAQGMMAKKDNAAAAKELADFAAGRSRGHHQLSFLRGVLAYQADDTQAAAKHFVQAIKLYPCFMPALRNLALVRYEQGQPGQAAGLAYRAYQLSKPPQPAYLYEAAAFTLAADQPAKALPWLQQLAAMPQPKRQWLTALLQAHLRLKQLPQARAVLQRLLSAYPGHARFWRLAASLATRQNQFARAAAALEVAYRLEPPGPSGWRQLGEIYRAAGVPLMAARCFEKAWGPVVKKPKHLDRLALIYLRGNYPQRALSWARRAASAQPSPKRLALVGRIQLSQKRYAEAFEAYAQAAKLGDKKGRYNLMAGYAAWQLERLPQAQRSFARALKLAKPGGGIAKDAARALKSISSLREAARRERAGANG
jgi:tetratricopeptide (TPR) repeat protein